MPEPHLPGTLIREKSNKPGGPWARVLGFSIENKCSPPELFYIVWYEGDWYTWPVDDDYEAAGRPERLAFGP